MDDSAKVIIRDLIPVTESDDTSIEILDLISNNLKELYGDRVSGLDEVSGVLRYGHYGIANNIVRFPYCQIVFATNHYVVLHAVDNNNIMVYDSLPYNETRMNYIKTLTNKPLLYSNRFDQGTSSMCGQYASATAFYVCQNSDTGCFLGKPPSPYLKNPILTFRKIIEGILVKPYTEWHFLWEIETFERRPNTRATSARAENNEPRYTEPPPPYMEPPPPPLRYTEPPPTPPTKKSPPKPTRAENKPRNEGGPPPKRKRTETDDEIYSCPVTIPDPARFQFDYDPMNQYRRTISALTSFLDFTVYNTVNYTMKRYYGIKNSVASLPKTLTPPPILASLRCDLNAYEYTRLNYNNNAPVRRAPETTFLETALRKKRDIQMTELIRQGVGKDAERFRTQVYNKLFYVQPVWIPPNVTWKDIPPKFVHRVVKGDGIEYVFDNQLIALNKHHLDTIFSTCFSVAVPQIDLEDHKYLTRTITAVNNMASTVNAIGIGKATPMSLLLECLRAKYGHETVNDTNWFFNWLEHFKFTSLDPDTTLDSDFGAIFDRKKLMKYVNEGGSLNFEDCRTVLLIKDYFSDVALHILSEMVILKLLWHLGISSPSLRSVIALKYRNCITKPESSGPLVCQWFPGIFTLLCNWAKKYEHHNLKFVSLLYNLSRKKYVRETYVRLQRSTTYEITEIALAVLDSFLGGYDLNDTLSEERRGKYKLKHIMADSNNYVQDHMCHFIKNNSFK